MSDHHCCRWQGPPPGGIQQQGGRPLGGRQQPGSPQSQAEERDPWAELQGEASRTASRGAPPGGFRGGFAGGFQGRSRELLNLKQRQVLAASQPILYSFSMSYLHASSALDFLAGTWVLGLKVDILNGDCPRKVLKIKRRQVITAS